MSAGSWIDKLTPEGERFKREMKKLSKMEVRVGFQAGEAVEDDGTDIVDVAAWNELGTSTAPSRPFLRKSVDENRAKLEKLGEQQTQRIIEGVETEDILKDIGVYMRGLVQDKIRRGEYAPNAPSTIASKGSDKPLIDTGRMRQSVNYYIKRKGEK